MNGKLKYSIRDAEEDWIIMTNRENTINEA